MENGLKEGYTTGSCAAAAAKAATFILLQQQGLGKVTITLPGGEKATFLIESLYFDSQKASCCIIKNAGDDPDITHGAQIWAKAVKQTQPGVVVKGGHGIGRVTKAGLPLKVGQAAINPIPMQMITQEVLEIMTGCDHGIEIEISIPNGEELALKTLNSHLGIIGGLSILGTTGIVKPMSEDAFKNSLTPQLKITYAAGYDIVVLTPGNIGHKSALSYGIPDSLICQTSNFIGFMLEEAVKIGFKKILLWGHPGKLLKIAGGCFYTHNRICDGRLETLALYLSLLNAPQSLVLKVLDTTTTEAAFQLTEEAGYLRVWELVADKVSSRAQKFLFNQAVVGVVLLRDRQHILTFDQNAKQLGEDLNWPFLQ